MNRTDRLYALVEELRVIAPRPRSGRWLAERFEVSVRTIERDISALQQAGTPIWSEPGRTGGYCLDPLTSLPPVNFTPSEAVAMAIALEAMSGTPFERSAHSALQKLVAAMPGNDVDAARKLAARVHLLGGRVSLPPVPSLIADALSVGRVLRISYQDRGGVETTRDVEPLGYVGKTANWYLIGWCRLRGGIRAFRTDRISSSITTAETPTPRALRAKDLDIPYGEIRQPTML